MNPRYAQFRVLLLALISSAVISCGGGGGPPDTTPPTVLVGTENPTINATGVSVATQVSVTFSEAMNCATLTAAGTFTLSPSIAGTPGCTGATATFTPTTNLASNILYTATITTAAEDLAGNALASNYSWSFTTQPAVSVTVSWNANRETAVNTAGGGYTVYYSTSAGFGLTDADVTTVDVPYVSGPLAPTLTTIDLTIGTYYFKIVAYSALNPPGGSSGSQSGPSAEISVTVP